MVAGLPFSIWLFYTLVVASLTALGSVGCYLRDNYRCNYDEQCNYYTPFGSNALTTDGQCSCNNHLTCGLHPDWAHSIDSVAPPLFMANPVQGNVDFGASEGGLPLLSPGALQYMAVMSAASTIPIDETGTNNGAPDGNNFGYNLGVFNVLVNRVSSTSPAADTPQTQLAAALAKYMYRQMFSPEAYAGGVRIVPDDGNTDVTPSRWCSARILFNLIPIQPFFTVPHGPKTPSTTPPCSGLDCYASCSNPTTSPTTTEQVVDETNRTRRTVGVRMAMANVESATHTLRVGGARGGLLPVSRSALAADSVMPALTSLPISAFTPRSALGSLPLGALPQTHAHSSSNRNGSDVHQNNGIGKGIGKGSGEGSGEGSGKGSGEGQCEGRGKGSGKGTCEGSAMGIETAVQQLAGFDIVAQASRLAATNMRLAANSTGSGQGVCTNYMTNWVPMNGAANGSQGGAG